MLKKYLYFSLLFLFSSLCVYGQTIHKYYKGIIFDHEQKTVLDEVICQGMDKDQQVVSYTISDKNGFFALESKGNIKSIIFRLLGYGKTEIQIEEIITPDNIKIGLKKENFILEEITVTVSPIQRRNDTISYNVNSFKSQEDRYIVDILKKLPGIKVSDDGSITYQGETINKFYIEGRDLLGGQYNIATNNLNVDAVSQVEVLENNQHIKALKNIKFSEKAAINLKLKKGYTIKPFGEVALSAGGTPAIYDEKIFITHLGHKIQSLANFKISNRGKYILDEMEDKLDMNNVFSYEPLPDNLIIPSSLQNIPLPLERYLFNKTYMGSINSLLACSNNTEVKLNLSYGSDQTSQNFFSQQNYATGENTLQIDEQTRLKNKIDNYRLSVTVENNTDNKYIKNELVSWGKQGKIHSGINSNNRNVSTFNKNYPFYIQNDFQGLIKYKGDNTINLNSFIRYSDNKESLIAGIKDTNIVDLEEKFNGEYILNKNRISTSFNLLGQQLDIGLNITYKQRNLDNGILSSENTGLNDLNMNDLKNKTEQLQIGIHPSYQIKNGNKIITTINIPVAYSKYKTKNHSEKSLSDERILFMPTITNNYIINHHWELYTRFGYDYRYANDNSLLSNPYFRNYRTIYIPSGKLNSSRNYNISSRIKYKDIIKLLFFNINVLYRISRFDYINRSYNTDEWSYYTTEEMNNTGTQLMINSDLSKTFIPIKLTLTLNPSYTRIKSEFIQQNILINNIGNTASLGIKAEVKALKKANITYQINGKATWNENNLSDNVVLKNLIQKLSIYYFPNKNIDISANADYTLLEQEKTYIHPISFWIWQPDINLKK